MTRRAQTDDPGAPAHLSPQARAWFDQVVATFELESHHLRLLQLACEAWDLGQDARTTIATEGAVYVDRFGAPRPHPSIAIGRDARVGFARIMRDLNLDGAPEPDARVTRRSARGGR